MPSKKPISSKIDFILASGSPRRKQLLRAAGFKFEIIPSQVSEKMPSKTPPGVLVRALAIKKAIAISKKYPQQLVLGADTIVYINGHVVGKPRNAVHAKRILEELSGHWQKVYTGVAFSSHGGKKIISKVGISRVKIRKLSEMDIRRASTQHLDKAGAYAVQQKKDPFVEKIVGDYDNVVGLPVKIVKRLLSRWSRRR
ncbi:MAG: Maf family protein [Elusimicrobiota bacterium]